MGSTKESQELLPGTLDLLILRTLQRGSMHGYGIAQHLRVASQDVLQVGESSLYPALQRLLLNGWISGEWGLSDNNRRARYYALTPSGRSGSPPNAKASNRSSGRFNACWRPEKMPPLFRRLGYWLHQRRADEDLAEELQFHREMVERDLIQDGLSRQDASAPPGARWETSSSLARMPAQCGYCLGSTACGRTSRHGVRSLRRSPGLVIVSALSLGLGIGLNVILYMGVLTIFGHQPTMVEPDRMVGVEPSYANQFSVPTIRTCCEPDLRGAAGFQNRRHESRQRRPHLACQRAGRDRELFQVLGVSAQMGRPFSAHEAASETDPRLVVVTAGFWKTNLRARPCRHRRIAGPERRTIHGRRSSTRRIPGGHRLDGPFALRAA